MGRIIIAGNSLHRPEQDEIIAAGYNIKQKRLKSGVIAPLKEFDMFLTEMCATMHVS